jgi:hypothetical protein
VQKKSQSESTPNSSPPNSAPGQPYAQ